MFKNNPNLTAQNSALSSAEKLLKSKLVEKPTVVEQLKEGNVEMSNLKSNIDNLFSTSYHNNHSKRVKLGKLQAKRERFSCYYANGDISEEDYRKRISDLDALEAEINCTPPEKAIARHGIVMCRTQKENIFRKDLLALQEQRLTDYCNSKNINVMVTYKLIGRMSEYKPLFDDIIDYIKDQEDRVAIICDKVSRFLYTAEDYYKIDSLVKKGKLELHFVLDNIVISQESNSNDLLHYGLIMTLTERLAS